jgi:hypothetical protein
MSGAIVHIRLTPETKDIAQIAFKTGEMIELRDRYGVVHRGKVVTGVEYEFGIDSGFFCWFQHEKDWTKA